VSPEGPKSEAGRAEIGRVLGEGKFPSPPARGTGERCKLPVGSGAKPERSGDLKAAPGVDFADTKFIFNETFVRSEPQKTSQPNFCRGPAS